MRRPGVSQTVDGLDFLASTLRAFRDSREGQRLPAYAEQILFHLARQSEGCAMADLRAYLGISSQRLSRICARLRSQGQVAVGKSPQDARVVLVRITPRGRQLIDKSLALSGGAS